MIFLAGSEASGKTKKAFAYGWKERKTSEDGVLLFSLQHEKKEMWKILQSMYGQEELSKIEIDDTPVFTGIFFPAIICSTSSRRPSKFRSIYVAFPWRLSIPFLI